MLLPLGAGLLLSFTLNPAQSSSEVQKARALANGRVAVSNARASPGRPSIAIPLRTQKPLPRSCWRRALTTGSTSSSSVWFALRIMPPSWPLLDPWMLPALSTLVLSLLRPLLPSLLLPPRLLPLALLLLLRMAACLLVGPLSPSTLTTRSVSVMLNRRRDLR
jgi:hypothetical protein